MKYHFIVRWLLAYTVIWIPGDRIPDGTPVMMNDKGQRYYEVQRWASMVTEDRYFAWEFFTETKEKVDYYNDPYPFAIHAVEIDSFRTLDLTEEILKIINQ